MKSQAFYQQRIEGVLKEILSTSSYSSSKLSFFQLNEAMRYSVLGEGKRVRPFLVYATGHALGIPIDLLDKPAAAIELIHAYSLVHDDLPCMDDDDLRRGQATTHIKFDEATAVLAGDALQALAFEVLSEPVRGISFENQLKMLKTLTSAAGSSGMVLGQAIDLSAVGKVLSENELETMHSYKTGALIRASVIMASYCKDNDHGLEIESKIKSQRKKLHDYAEAIGLAFQVRDDILDIQSDTETLGKPQGADIAAGKPTYPSILGMTATKEKLYQLHKSAIESLSGFGAEADQLREIAEFIVKRIA